MFVDPATPVYEGMIVGENSRPNDLDVNITQREEADEHARVDGRRSDPPDSAAPAQPRAGHRVHQRRRAGRGDAEAPAAAQARARREHAAEATPSSETRAIRRPSRTDREMAARTCVPYACAWHRASVWLVVALRRPGDDDVRGSAGIARQAATSSTSRSTAPRPRAPLHAEPLYRAGRRPLSVQVPAGVRVLSRRRSRGSTRSRQGRCGSRSPAA